jgi:hypothetical protein
MKVPCGNESAALGLRSKKAQRRGRLDQGRIKKDADIAWPADHSIGGRIRLPFLG